MTADPSTERDGWNAPDVTSEPATRDARIGPLLLVRHLRDLQNLAIFAENVAAFTVWVIWGGGCGAPLQTHVSPLRNSEDAITRPVTVANG